MRRQRPHCRVAVGQAALAKAPRRLEEVEEPRQKFGIIAGQDAQDTGEPGALAGRRGPVWNLQTLI
jgi:hypothetical protein